MIDDNRLAYSVAEAAEHAGVCRDTIYGAITSGALTARKLGRRTLILKAELDGYLRSLPLVAGNHPNRGNEKADRR
ncbi:helix-turn-helix domain-containing protein [Hyphomicrobium sp. NDB2Meth4]|uniref:helix-turn-helix domain-containing protein n=1 Tax=Hyphomicrobium sp. NDB2Meth4 TaxID=1892846 RepID=UPI00092FE928|nr:helix-turn-helix domain-containing protein [Hyphomicrobium sp. NDB2Meth4]